ncbi:hypothetical protein [Capnocytophaga canis]|uniref:Uncharacterized protein n=1 Tax=Capnocytophaga canis TaxID=1848903 RepID=A0A0B7IPP2_9FLAO|nr:hypothetical protein [Capnocytophaga canis]CEN53775.1 hypothetical protein CCAND93_560004 [Capnocytophaga canis]
MDLIKAQTSKQFSEILEKHVPIYERIILKKSPYGRFVDSNFWETFVCIENLIKNVNDTETFEQGIIELLEHHNFMIGEFCLIVPNSDEAVMLDNLRKDFLDICINYLSTAKGIVLSKEKVSDIHSFCFSNFYKSFKDKKLKKLNIISR